MSGNGNGAELQADTLFTAGGRLGQALDQNGDARVVRVPTSAPGARDARGAAGAATLRVVVERRPLRVVSLRFPRVVAPGATQVSGRIAVSEPAVLVSGARRVMLGRAVRRVRLALPGRPRTGIVRATYALRPRGADVAGAVRGVVEVVRR